MFDVGWSEMLVVGAVALIVIGPKDLPGALRTLGQSIGKIKRMAGEFKQQFDDAMREAEVDKIKEDLAKAEADARAAADFNFNPIEAAKEEIKAAMDPPKAGESVEMADLSKGHSTTADGEAKPPPALVGETESIQPVADPPSTPAAETPATPPPAGPQTAPAEPPALAAEPAPRPRMKKKAEA